MNVGKLKASPFTLVRQQVDKAKCNDYTSLWQALAGLAEIWKRPQELRLFIRWKSCLERGQLV